jgi:hypothetical protein
LLISSKRNFHLQMLNADRQNTISVCKIFLMSLCISFII